MYSPFLLLVEKEAVGSGSSTTSLRTLSSTRLSPSYLSLRPSFIGIEIEEPGFQYEPIFDGIFSQQVLLPQLCTIGVTFFQRLHVLALIFLESVDAQASPSFGERQICLALSSHNFQAQ